MSQKCVLPPVRSVDEAGFSACTHVRELALLMPIGACSTASNGQLGMRDAWRSSHHYIGTGWMRCAQPCVVQWENALPRSHRADPLRNRRRLDTVSMRQSRKRTTTLGVYTGNTYSQCDKLSGRRLRISESSRYDKAGSTAVGSAAKMAAVLPGSHTYNNPVANDHARMFSGDVKGQVHMGDNNYYGR